MAFYIHLAALPADDRPDLANHPIISRLLELKKGVADLEELDFSAGSVSDGDPLMESFAEKMGMEIPEGGLTPEMKAELMKTLAKMREEGLSMGEDDEDELDGIQEMEDDDFEDFDDSWKGAGLEEDELADLLADVDEDMEGDSEDEPVAPVKVKKAKSKSSKEDKKVKAKTTEDGKKKRVRKVKEPAPEPIANFTPLAEPSFHSSKKTKSSRPLSADDDTLGDATSLLDADASDKERRTKSLRFHTSKIASTSNRRAAARAQRLGGDEDVPYRDRQKARDAALRKNSSAAAQEGGEDLDGAEWSESDKKRAREVREEVNDDDAGVDDGAGEYYDLVKRRKTEKIEEKEAAHEAWQADKLYVTYVDPDQSSSTVHLSRMNRQMVQERSPELLKRTEVLHPDETRQAVIPESKRGWHTRRPSRRSARRGQCTKVVKLLLVEIMLEKRLVSRLWSNRGSSRQVDSLEIWCYMYGSVQRPRFDCHHPQVPAPPFILPLILLVIQPP